jgi:exosortase H (IPTLxxWG-CTERM-specific)
LVLSSSLPDSAFAPLNRATASMSGEFLALFGKNAVVSGDVITLNNFRVHIVTECTALYPVILFSAFLMAVPASLKARLAGLAAGVPFLGSVNMLRIAAVTVVGANMPALFEICHVYLGQVVMVCMVIAACLAWFDMVRPQGPRLQSLFFIIRFGVCCTLLFLVWFVFNVAYVKLTDDTVVRWFFSLKNVKLEIPYQHMIYYQTFNLVAFMGLVMAGGTRLLRQKLPVVAAGLAVIVGMHILFRIGNVLMTVYAMESARRISDVIYIIGQYMIPVLLWIMLFREKMPLKCQGDV